MKRTAPSRSMGTVYIPARHCMDSIPARAESTSWKEHRAGSIVSPTVVL